MLQMSRYWQMMVLTITGQCQHQGIPLVQQWFQVQWAEALRDSDLTDREIQAELWVHWRNGQKAGQEMSLETALLARLCLRCWVSHQIATACRQLALQFGKTYGFTVADLWPLVLDDEGQVEPTYMPLTLKILEKYDPDRAALSTWAVRLTKSHPEVSRFLIDLGLYRISDWAILNDTTVAQLPRVLPHLSAGELQQASQLLRAYHRVYRQARLAQRQSGQGGRCLEPTAEQLAVIMPQVPPNLLLAQLHDLADQLRQYRIAVRRGTPLAQSLDGTEGENANIVDASDEAEEAQKSFLQRYRAHFLDQLDEAIEQITQGYAVQYRQRKPPRDEAFRQGLNLFHCQGLSMGEIAQQIGLTSQVQVTRLLQLKRFRAEVCAYWFQTLKKQVQADALAHITAERLNQIAQQLDQILTEETAAVMAEAAAEAQIPKHRTTHSVFARRLCQTLFSSGNP